MRLETRCILIAEDDHPLERTSIKCGNFIIPDSFNRRGVISLPGGGQPELVRIDILMIAWPVGLTSSQSNKML